MVWRNESLEQWTFHKRAIRWLLIGGLYSLLASVVFAYLSFPIAFLFENGFSRGNFGEVWRYIVFNVQNPASIFTSYFEWFAKAFSGKVLAWYNYLPLFAPSMLIFGGIITFFSNPYEFGAIPYGNAKLANKKDIEQLGYFKGFMIVLGSFKGKLLKFPDTMSALCVAPPGTGKTASVVVPTILETDNACIFINDGKEELAPLTSGYRSTLGPVFMFNWGAVDDPENGDYWPKWNPLTEGNIPPPCPGRENYIGGLAFFLIKDGPVGTDPYWIKMARSSLEGLITYIVNKCEQAMANDYFLGQLYDNGGLDDEDYKVLESYYLSMKCDEAKEAIKNVRRKNVTVDNFVPVGSWDGIPKGWRGCQPSFPMLLDWLTEQQMRANSHSKALAEGGDIKALSMDIMKEVILAALEECVHFGYSRRAIMELNQLSDVPQKQRGSILSTALAGLSLFKNTAVRERTSASDFFSEFMRGRKNPVTDIWEPITVYISVPSGDADFLSPVTSLFLEMNAGFFIVFKPNEAIAGPFPALYVLDEFGVMPNMGAVLDGLCAGHSHKISYLLIVQDLSQISGKYGGDALEVIISNTSAKIVMQQNNENTASRFAGMTDYRTVYVKSKSSTEFMGVNKTPFTYGVSYNPDYKTIVDASMLMNLPSNLQVVICPRLKAILADQPRYYMNRDMLKKTQIPESYKFPEYLRAIRDEQDHRPPQSSFDAIGSDSDNLISFGLFSREVQEGEKTGDKKARYEVDDEWSNEWQDFEDEWQEFESEWADDYENFQDEYLDYNAYNDYENYEYYDNYSQPPYPSEPIMPQDDFYDYDPSYNGENYEEYQNETYDNYETYQDYEGYENNYDDIGYEENIAPPASETGEDAWWLQDNVFDIPKANHYQYRREQYKSPEPQNYSPVKPKAMSPKTATHEAKVPDISQDGFFTNDDFFEEDTLEQEIFEDFSNQKLEEDSVFNDFFEDVELDENAFNDAFADEENKEEPSNKIEDEFAEAPSLEDFFDEFDDYDDSFEDLPDDEK